MNVSVALDKGRRGSRSCSCSRGRRVTVPSHLPWVPPSRMRAGHCECRQLCLQTEEEAKQRCCSACAMPHGSTHRPRSASSLLILFNAISSIDPTSRVSSIRWVDVASSTSSLRQTARIVSRVDETSNGFCGGRVEWFLCRELGFVRKDKLGRKSRAERLL